MPVCLKISKMTGCINEFNDEQLFKNCNEIWKKS